MIHGLLPYDPVLAGGVRIPSLARPDDDVRTVELVTLIALGIAAACATQLLDAGLGIPGHAIVRSVLPFSLGLALVPRRRAGIVMGSTAVGAGMLFNATPYAGAGAGALTSLFLSGFLLDQAASRAHRGWPLYIGVALAGLTTNLIAFGVKTISKLGTTGGLGGGGGRSGWLGRAVISYPLCGLIAGLLCAFLLFKLRSRTEIASDI